MILQALFNLIENAVKHTSTDTKINLSIRYASDEQIEFAVTDEGPGISLEEQQKIFEPFYTGSNKYFKDNQKHGTRLIFSTDYPTQTSIKLTI